MDGGNCIPNTSCLNGILAAIGEAFLISGTISLIADQLVRRDVSNFWLDAIGIENSIRTAGLEQISIDFHSFPFKKYIQSAKDIDICVMYAKAWLNYNYSDLKDFLAKDGRTLRVCLLAEDSSSISGIAESIGHEEADIRRTIAESVAQLKSCADDLEKEGKLKGRPLIYKHKQSPRHTYYRFDGVVMLVPYNLVRGRPKIPVFEFRDVKGGVSEFLKEDFEKLITAEYSKPIYDSKKLLSHDGAEK